MRTNKAQMTSITGASDGSILALYKALTTIGLLALLLLAGLDIIGDDMMSAALHPGFGFFPTTFALFFLVVGLSGKRQGLGLGYFPKPVWDNLARATTVLLVSLTLLRGYEFFTGNVLAWIEPMLGARGVGSYTSFWTLAGLTALHSLDVHCPRNPSQYRRWFSYALFFSVVSICLHQLSDIVLDNSDYYLEGLSAISAAWLLAFAAFLFPRTVAHKMLFEPRAPKANIASASTLALVLVLLLLLKTFAPYPGLVLPITGVMLLGLPIFIFVFRPLEIEARIARGEIDEGGASLAFVPAPRSLDIQANTATELSALERGVSALLFTAPDWQRYGVQAGLTFLLAYGAIVLSRTAESDIAMLWWANTHLAFTIFNQKDGQYLKTLAAFALALVAANILAGNTLLASVLLTAVNATEGVLIGILARTVFGVQNTGVTLNMMRAFTIPRLMLAVAFAIGIMGITAVIGSTLISLVFNAGVFDNFAPWFFGSVLGMFSLMPLLVGLILENGLRYEKLTPKIPYLGPLCVLYALGVFSFYAFAPTTVSIPVPNMGFILASIPLVLLPSLQLAGALVFLNTIVYYGFYFGRWLADGPSIQVYFLIVLVPILITIGIMARHQYARRQRAEQRALDFAPNALITLDDDGRILSISKNAQEWFEVDAATLYGRRLIGFFENKKALAEELEPFVQSTPSGTFEAKAIRHLSTGQELVFSGTVQGNQDASLPYSYVVSLLDITKEHELEKEKSQLVDRSKSVILVQDRDWNTLQCSDAWVAFTGCSREETLACDFHDFLHSEDLERAAYERNLLLDERSKIEDTTAPYRLVTKSGDIKLIKIRTMLEDKSEGGRFIMTLVDVTELEQQRRAFEELSKRSFGYLEAGTGIFGIQDEDFNLVYASELTKKYFGEEGVNNHPRMASTIYPEHDEAFWKAHRAEMLSMPTGKIWRSPKPELLVTPTGEHRRVIRSRRWFDNPTGEGRLIFTEATDVTDLVAAQSFNEQLLDKSRTIILTEQRDHKVVTCSEAWIDLMGYSREETVGSDLASYLIPEHQVYFNKHRQKFLDGSTVEGNWTPTFVKKDGTLVYTKLNVRTDLSSGEWRVIHTIQDITELQAKTVELERAYKSAEGILSAGTTAYFIQDENYECTFASKTMLSLLGYSSLEELPSVPELFSNIDADYLAHRQKAQLSIPTGQVWYVKDVLKLTCKNGSQRNVKMTRRWFDNPTGKGRLLWTSLEDVTDLQRALKAANTFLDSQLTAVVIQREDFSWYYISDAFKEQLGLSSIEDFQNPALGFWENRDEAMVLKDRERLRALPTGVLNVNPDPFVFVTATGERLYFKVQNKWIDDPSGEGRLLLTSLENITELLAQQQRIQDQADALEIQAKTDPLTGLWNRLGLNDQLQIVEGAARDQDLAVYLLDVDFFKSVNDTYSHRVGDDLLIAVGKTLRDVGPENALVARLGGEEFLVATPWIDVETAKDFGGTLRRAVGETQIQSEGNTVSRTTSVGIAKLSRTDSLDATLSLADLALSEAKARGRNLDILADEAFHTEMEARGAFITETEIEAGLLAHEFKYYVQPIYNTERKEVEGFETLIRWIKADGSVVPPDMFLGQFNKVFFKPELQDVSARMRYDVLDSLRCYPDAYVSWNYELDQFLSDDFTTGFITRAEKAVEKYGTQLVVEISERGINARLDMADIERNLQRIRDAGFLIALDDFGTEQSNINRLISLPIDIIKFDKSLIEECDADQRAASTIRALSILANSLNIKVIGEGVETKRQASVLHYSRVTRQQGYFHARPMNPEILATQDVEIGQAVTRASTTVKPLEEYLG